MPRRLVKLISLWTCTNSVSTLSRKSCTESPPRDNQRCAGQCRMNITCACTRVLHLRARLLNYEYRTPSTVIRLSRTRATRAVAASGLWTGWYQSTRSVLYLRISHSRERASALVLAPSFARFAGTSILHTGSSTTVERESIFFFFFFLRTYVARTNTRNGGTQASRLFLARGHILVAGAPQTQGRTRDRGKGPTRTLSQSG